VEVVPTAGGLGPFAADPALAVQAFITAEPCAAEAQGLSVTFLPAREAGWNPYASVATVRTDDVDAPWVRAFRDATAAGWNAYLENPAPANALLLAANPQLTPTLLDCIVQKQAPYVKGTNGVGAMTAQRWDELAAALRSVGQEVKVEGAWKDLGAGAPAATP
jgi:NitT/TauT family transport system substrate-binding protein